MRSIAGFLCLALAFDAAAQARGDVESVGFGGFYRPGCWTPMVVRLTPTTGAQFVGRIEVVQEDLDRDQVIFTRQITLTGNPPDGTAREERFWMYFVPQPTKERGEIRPSMSPSELSEIIKVRLCSDSGKELVKLPITQMMVALDSTTGGDRRGERAILCVYDQHQPDLNEYNNVLGLNENVRAVHIRNLSSGLPDDVRGYDGVDGILWTDANAAQLGSDQTTALENFVRRGGKLVYCQDTQAGQFDRSNVNAQFAGLIPAIVAGIESREEEGRGTVATLRHLAKVPVTPLFQRPGVYDGYWDALKGPFRYAVGQPKPGATVVLWQTDVKGEPILDEATLRGKPFAIRAPVGAGCVTWVAMDLGDPMVRMTAQAKGPNTFGPLGERNATRGWANVWDALFDWPNDPQYDTGIQSTSPAAPYREGITWELGRSYLGSMNLDSTSAALIGIAVLFFVVYWVAAGPGSYLVLAKKGKSSLSWFTFAAIAIAATGLTVGIVKLVLRGAPQAKHFSIVRMTPGEATVVNSRLGLYVPRDGPQTIELKDAQAGRSSFITAFNLHPAFNTDASDFPARQTYEVPVREINKEQGREIADPKTIKVPYRSTLKKLTARWVGDVKGGISGKVTLNADVPKVRGSLVNDTGRDLRGVFLVVHHPEAVYTNNSYLGMDVVLYVSVWPDKSTLFMDDLFGADRTKAAPTFQSAADAERAMESKAGGIVRLRGYITGDRETRLSGSWTDVWYKDSYRKNWGGGDVKDENLLSPQSFPVLSFFDRLPPSRNGFDRNRNDSSRFDFLRRGVRDLDMSAAISGGQMAVIGVAASGEEPLPFPLEVDGNRVEGKGIVYYQCIVPVDGSAVRKVPSSQPASQPTNKPATAPATSTKGKAEG